MATLCERPRGLFSELKHYQSQIVDHKPRFHEQCKFYNGQTGCIRGNSCWYQHIKNQIVTTPAATLLSSNPFIELTNTLIKNQSSLKEQNNKLLYELSILKNKLNNLEIKIKREQNNCTACRDTARSPKLLKANIDEIDSRNYANCDSFSGVATPPIITQTIATPPFKESGETLNIKVPFEKIKKFEEEWRKSHNLSTEILFDGTNNCNSDRDTAVPSPQSNETQTECNEKNLKQTTKAGLPLAQKYAYPFDEQSNEIKVTDIETEKKKDINYDKIIPIKYPLDKQQIEFMNKKYFPNKKNQTKQAYFIYLNHMRNNSDISMEEYYYLLHEYREQLKKDKTTNRNNNKPNKNKTKFNNKRNKKNRK